MRSFILSLAILSLFSGCFTSSLSLNKEKELILKYDSNDLLLSCESESSKLLNFKDLFVSRYKLKNDNSSTLFYEVAKTSLSFEFSHSGLYTAMYLLNNSQKYEIVFERNNLLLAQVKLNSSKYLNIIIQAGDSQTYSFAYGFSNAEFLQIANKLMQEDEENLKELKYDAIAFTAGDRAIFNWSDEVVFFTPLIMPFRAYGFK